MARYQTEKSFFHGQRPCVGVLLTNLGTPDAATAGRVRAFLREFLSDARVVELPRVIWLPILYGAILPKRPAVVAKNYEKIWLEDGSPLLVFSKRQQAALQQELALRFNGPVEVELGMTYGNPSIASALEALKAKGAQRIVVLPLYPQYSGTTTAAVHDKVMAVFKRWRWLPEFRWINQYHDEPQYIKALAESVNQYWEKNGQSDHLLMSFHGIPLKNLQQGDPYHCHCHKTARLLAQALRLNDDAWSLSFQSRFGRAKWLEPATDDVLQTLAKSEKSQRIDVVCPGFAADCLETLEEIEIQNRELFIQAGGKEYHYIPALNDNRAHITALADLVQRHTSGWLENSSDWQESSVKAAADLTRDLSTKMGAKR